MSLRPQAVEPVPVLTAKVARAAFPKGNLYLKMRDELGTLFTDEDFTALYPTRGKPALSPWRLALVTVFQFAENLSDRQAAEAVRARIDWKYALSLHLDDPGFDGSVLVEFRARLAEGGAEQRLLDRMLEGFRERKLFKARGHQRTDSTHVIASVRAMNRLELVTETLRAALNDLAETAPDWLRSVAPTEWFGRYGHRAEETRLPKGEKARQEYAQTVGRDGFFLLARLEDKPGLTERQSVGTLRQVWERHFARSETGQSGNREGEAGGQVILRPASELSRAACAIESPYDPEARHSSKHQLCWTGYKVHISETCDSDLPCLITHMHTTVATTQDVACTADIHRALADKDLLPSRHLVDTGYVDADLLVHSQEQHGVELFGPPRLYHGPKARPERVPQSQFHIDWQTKRAVCPQGKASRKWTEYTASPYPYPLIRVRFSSVDCRDCSLRDKCLPAPTSRFRLLALHPQSRYEALNQARERMQTEQGRAEYRKRAGVEGTHSQGVRRSGLRQCRYRGLKKTQLQHVATAAALNVVRVVNYLDNKPVAQTRTSRFARLVA
jgi:transposase